MHTYTHTRNTYQSLLSFPINFLVSSSSIIVGGASEDGPYCADAIKRSVEGFNVSTCINKNVQRLLFSIILVSLFIMNTHLSVSRLRFHLSCFATETRTTLFVLDVSEIANQQDNTKYKAERSDDQKRNISCVIVLCVIRAHIVCGNGQEHEHANSNQYPADQNKRPVEPSWVSDLIQGAIDEAV